MDAFFRRIGLRGLLACVLCIVMGARVAHAEDLDLDGLNDAWESANGLDPADPTDADKDPDYDNYTNAEEFQGKSDPQDVDSPDITVFVSTAGNNSTGNGTRKAPWKTIAYALSQISGSSRQRGRIVVGSGAYTENLVLKPYVTVTGFAEPPTGGKAIRPTYAGVTGNHTGASHATLDNLYLYPAVTTKGILGINDVTMLVRNCVFYGPGYTGVNPSAGIGIQILTSRAEDSIIEKCDFSGLAYGIQSQGDFPLIRQDFFEKIKTLAIDIVGGRTIVGKISLGKATDPATGFNSFDIDTIGGSVINTDWSGTLQMENNTWKSTDLAVIGTKLNLSVNTFDIDPPNNATTYSLLPASIVCTVTNGPSDLRVETATVMISPSVYNPISDNTAGVYTVPAILPGSYSIQVEAPNFETTVQQITVQQSDVQDLLFELEQFSTADTDQNNKLSLGELLRLIQFYNTGGFHCDSSSEDSFAAGSGGDTSCTAHTSDYAPFDWRITLGELLRAIQFYNSNGYHACAGSGTEDGFCAGP